MLSLREAQDDFYLLQAAMLAPRSLFDAWLRCYESLLVALHPNILYAGRQQLSTGGEISVVCRGCPLRA